MSTQDQLDMVIRGPKSYEIASRALEQMKDLGISPTPLNYELWLFALACPQSAIGVEISKLVSDRRPLSDVEAESMALQYLPRLRLPEEMRETGDKLTQQLETIGKVITVAQKNVREYGKTLEGASRDLEHPQELAEIRRVVETLAASTMRAQRENAALETQLLKSTEEVRRLRENLEQVRRDSLTDALTNLANRKAFDDALNRACADSAQTGRPLTVAVLDIDHFKRFNDTWGHQAGDQVIRYVAAMIANACPQPRFAARYGGEEFAILFPNEGVGAVHKLIEAMCKDIASRSLKRRSTAEELGTVTVSAGVAELHRGELPSDVVERADSALYASKRNGRNRTTNAEALAA